MPAGNSKKPRRKNPKKKAGTNLTSWFNGQIYSVEAILGKRERNGSTEYLVKWEGWPQEFNSWESKEKILDQGSEAEKRNSKVE